MRYIPAAAATTSGLLLAGLASASSSSAATLRVPTTSGEAHGTVNATSSPHVRQFLGIPYAEPPVGARRFEAPVRYAAASPAKVVLNATAFAPSCLQPLSTPAQQAADLYAREMPWFLPGSPAQSEDCLYANVYAPLQPTAEKLPVFVWIHGGAFTSDGANVPYQIPDQWIERTQGHLVVTFNYRLNIFGFPSAEGQPINVGLLDQRMAVEWVRDNIAAFGGDVDRMVLWGQSAGAWSVNTYGYAYATDPIVKGLIADSGGSSVFSAGDPGNFTAVAAAAGCADTDDADAQLDCMKDVDAKTLQALYSNTSGVSFGPAADNVTIFADTTARAERGLVAQVPAIVGTNAREGASFVAWSYEDGVNETEVRQGGSVIVCPTVEEINRRVDNGLATYRYLYSGNFSNVTPLPWIGATHSSELPLIFGTHAQYRHNSTPFEWDVSHAMEGLWLAFAENVNKAPSYGAFTWPRYEARNGKLASFALNGTAVQLGSPAEMDALCG
ncbi:Alpha/Beta hydrolase protein [Xylariomycetidae sp. FL0641]|nr:Alpha/Beta hydrolase protein [Xylariomycetidae sp. FL0641]